MKIEIVKQFRLVPAGKVLDLEYESAMSLIKQGFAKSLEVSEEVSEVQEEKPIKKLNKK